MQSTHLLTLQEAARDIRTGALSSAGLWKQCKDRIERLNPQLNAFITLMDGEELLQPASQMPVASEMLPLGGTPIAVKDLFETAGVRTTAGALFFKDHIPAHDAAAVTKVRNGGGRIIGKTNTHEIALGVTTVNPHFGACRNPWNTDRIPGGSSGGSAVAVATSMALAALGTDTGGSIRIPASLCGVVGLKPTYGRVSLRGAFPLSWNLDHAGPLARCVADAALMLQVIAGYDADDPHSVDHAADDYMRHLEDGVHGWGMVLATGRYTDDADPEILEAVHGATRVFQGIGARITERDLGELREAALANGIMTQADAAAFHRQRLSEHPEMFGSDVRKRLETGRGTTSTDYVLARQAQAVIKRQMAMLFQDFDILLLPTTAITAPLIADGDAVEQARRLTRFTAPFNLTGLPAISVPCGFSQQGLPIGLQLVAAPWREAQLLQAARAYERETDWSRRQPECV